jgi:ribonuclease E
VQRERKPLPPLPEGPMVMVETDAQRDQQQQQQ